MLRWILAALLVVLATACSSAQTSDLAIYDWEAQHATASQHAAHDLRCRPEACPEPSSKTVYVVDAPRLTADDLDRESVRADVDAATGEAIVTLQLTPKGQELFEAMTRSLAQRGARVGTPQHMLIVIDDVVYASPYIDFRRNPRGVPADSGIQLSGMTSPAEARELAKRLRGEA